MGMASIRYTLPEILDSTSMGTRTQKSRPISMMYKDYNNPTLSGKTRRYIMVTLKKSWTNSIGDISKRA